MKSSYLTNLVLLVIVIVLLWFSQREKPSTEQVPTLSTLTADDVNQIQIHRPGKPNLSLQRQQQNWVLTEPFNARANETRVNLLLSLLSAPLHGQFQPMDEASLGQFGLNQPEVILSMNNEQFSFGGVESLSQNRYVLHEGMIYLVQDDVTPLLTAAAGSFVDNRLIADNSRITRLVIPAGADAEHTITLQEVEGQWRSDNAAISSDTLKTLVDGWQHAYAMQVGYLVDSHVASLPKPQVVIWLEGQAEPLQLVVTQSGQNLQLINPALQLQYEFPLALQSQLFPKLQD